jgi:phage baseplate assembly protein W
MINDDFIGAGWSFPLRFTATGGIALSRRERELEESMRLILATSYGERPMRPEFGSAIHDYVYAEANAATSAALAIEVRKALTRWEPRVRVMDVDVTSDEANPSLLYIDVRYSPVDTNDPRNLVFPFYTIPGEAE